MSVRYNNEIHGASVAQTECAMMTDIMSALKGKSHGALSARRRFPSWRTHGAWRDPNRKARDSGGTGPH
jgi:hypothetical protein